MEILLGWIILSIIVAVAANTRGRNPGGWFILAVIISPLLAGLLVLALPKKDQSWTDPPTQMSQQTTKSASASFAADGVYNGIPYRVVQGSVVEAAMPPGIVRFKNMDHFISAATGKTSA